MSRIRFTPNSMRSSASVMDRTANSNGSSERKKHWWKGDGAIICIKYFAIIKQVLVILYILRSVHSNLELDVLCYDEDDMMTSEGFPKVKICLRPSCLWVHWVVLRLPRWLVQDLPEGVCTGLLFFTLSSSLLMLLALYRCEVEKKSGAFAPLWFKVIIVLPSVLVEVLFTMLMCNGIISGAWHWRKFKVSTRMMVLAAAYAVILCFSLLIVFLLHLAAVIYVCRCSKHARHQLTDCSPGSNTSDSPTATVLATLKYQAEAERAPLISPPNMNSSFRNKATSLDTSSVSNNGLNLSHASYAPPPKKTHTVESPPYARLRPFTFHMGDPMSVKGSSPHSKSHGLNNSFQSGYASTKPYDLWKVLPTDSRPGTISLHEYSSLE